ncbi:50S ribosomal protein L18 [Campylobacter hyointestinalis]|uniref:Large ribosomal subunit protein uL18 n=1 Tax=Campylobacter hyointestinalis subsp. hyointestinalis TaxID=91352 RepID=A0A855NEM3_CAMHY|nr:50S ribosomal protein L18 [Campylobacter hyointestinalis]ANE31819.1 50S ribosomal protein L18 [Campylobacter hyointestinalis subsp. hyointestinalis LMG 9260]KEA44121.1 50S ribosomal protein L18 [Campylobacter hyointestinalis subsp. hyointestinalis]MBT0612352.1 50S ribosomal protein L18 [Campylobacter hyointestinalis subsp. hyointestinalis]MDL2346040.1 50S ribosomal protein L18 [Campylobacter hyointestinalis]MDL2347780.1 50S ribosomal protein L18 [Campylobacter hyointestinalis]
MVANILKRKISLRIKRKRRIRAKINGTASCPRISIFKSNRTIYVQAIEDINATTLCASDGRKLGIKANKEGAVILAKDIAGKLSAKGINEAVFDRNGYLYHGVVAAFAEALRENGIKL